METRAPSGPAPGTPGVGKPGELGTPVPVASRLPGIPAIGGVDTMGNQTGMPATEPAYPRYGSQGSTPQPLSLPALPGIPAMPAVDAMGNVTGGGDQPSYPYQPAPAQRTPYRMGPSGQDNPPQPIGQPAPPAAVPMRTYPPMAGPDLAAANARNPVNLQPPAAAPMPQPAPAAQLNNNSWRASPIPAFGQGGAAAPPVGQNSGWQMPAFNMPSLQTPEQPAVDPMGSTVGGAMQPAAAPPPRLSQPGGGGYQVRPIPDPGPGGAAAPPVRMPQPAQPRQLPLGPNGLPRVGKPYNAVMPGQGVSGGAQGSSWLGNLFGG